MDPMAVGRVCEELEVLLNKVLLDIVDELISAIPITLKDEFEAILEGIPLGINEDVVLASLATVLLDKIIEGTPLIVPTVDELKTLYGNVSLEFVAIVFVITAADEFKAPLEDSVLIALIVDVLITL